MLSNDNIIKFTENCVYSSKKEAIEERDFNWKVNSIMYKIRAMEKLEDEELAVIRYEINKAFEPIIDKTT